MSLQDEDTREDAAPDSERAEQSARLEMELSLADSIRSTTWEPAFGSWQELVSLLTDHHEQEVKDGPCFVPGRVLGSQRKETDVVSLGLAMLDVDNGEDIERICGKVAAAGYEALVHTTHSHGRTHSTIKLSAYARHANGDEIVLTCWPSIWSSADAYCLTQCKICVSRSYLRR